MRHLNKVNWDLWIMDSFSPKAKEEKEKKDEPKESSDDLIKMSFNPDSPIFTWLEIPEKQEILSDEKPKSVNWKELSRAEVLEENFYNFEDLKNYLKSNVDKISEDDLIAILNQPKVKILVEIRSCPQHLIDLLKIFLPSVSRYGLNYANRTDFIKRSNLKYIKVLNYLLVEDDYYKNFLDFETCESFCINYGVYFTSPFFKKILPSLITYTGDFFNLLVSLSYNLDLDHKSETALRLFLGEHPEFIPRHLKSDTFTHTLSSLLTNNILPTGVIKIIFQYALEDLSPLSYPISHFRSLLIRKPISLLGLNPVIAVSDLTEIQLRGNNNIVVIRNNIPTKSDLYLKWENPGVRYVVFSLRPEDKYLHRITALGFVALYFRWAEGSRPLRDALAKLNHDTVLKFHDKVPPYLSLLDKERVDVNSWPFNKVDVESLSAGLDNGVYVHLYTSQGVQACFQIAFQLGLINPMFHEVILRYMSILKTLDKDTLISNEDFARRIEPLKTYANGISLFKNHQPEAQRLLKSLSNAPIKSEELIQEAIEEARKNVKEVNPTGGFITALGKLGNIK